MFHFFLTPRACVHQVPTEGLLEINLEPLFHWSIDLNATKRRVRLSVFRFLSFRASLKQFLLYKLIEAGNIFVIQLRGVVS